METFVKIIFAIAKEGGSRMKYSQDFITYILTAKDVAERNGFNYIPEIIAFGTFATIENFEFHKELAKKGAKHSDIVKCVKELYKKYLWKEDEDYSKFNNIVQMSENTESEFRMNEPFVEYENEIGSENRISVLVLNIMQEEENVTMPIYMSTKTLDILKHSQIIAENKKEKATTNAHIFSALKELMPDIYSEFIKECFNKQEERTNGQALQTRVTNRPVVIPQELKSFLTVMNEKYSAEEKECKILGRDKELENLTKILCKSTKRNAVLVGHPGVGKTALVEKLVWNIVTGKCCDRLKGAVVLSLDITALIAGTNYRGTAEARFQWLVKFLESNPRCILFIDEIHTILGAGACVEGGTDLANSLKPILSKGDTQVIGATTFDEYERYFSRDGALKRRFEKIVVNEPLTTELYDMIKNQISNLEKYHHTKISKELIDFAILNASCFNNEIKNPDRTLDLIDKTMAGVELKGKNEISKEDILENFAIMHKVFQNMSEKAKKVTAYHEAGHYIIRRFSPELQNYNTLAVSIMPAEDYLGINVFEPVKYAISSYNEDYYVQMIAMYLGGRIAESLFAKEDSSGGMEDFKEATKIATNMVTKYGLGKVSECVGRVYDFYGEEKLVYPENVIKRIDKEIDNILFKANLYAEKLLVSYRNELEILVSELVKKGILSKVELENIFSDYTLFEM